MSDELAQAQAATATLLALIAVAWYVLVVVARPYTWWKILLLAVSAGSYVLIFLLPLTQHWFKLDSSNLWMMSVGAIAAAIGMVGVEIVEQILTYRARRAAADDADD